MSVENKTAATPKGVVLPENPATPRKNVEASTSASEKLEQAGDKIEEVRRQFNQKTEELTKQAEQAKVKAEELNDRAVTLIQERPVVAVAGAFAVGYLVGRLAMRRWLA